MEFINRNSRLLQTVFHDSVPIVWFDWMPDRDSELDCQGYPIYRDLGTETVKRIKFDSNLLEVEVRYLPCEAIAVVELDFPCDDDRLLAALERADVKTRQVLNNMNAADAIRWGIAVFDQARAVLAKASPCAADMEGEQRQCAAPADATGEGLRNVAL